MVVVQLGIAYLLYNSPWNWVVDTKLQEESITTIRQGNAEVDLRPTERS